MRRLSAVALMTAGVITADLRARGEGQYPAIPPDLVLERFSVAKNGGDLLVPVRVAGKDHPFVVDTGATGTIFDTSFSLGHPVRVVKPDGADGKVMINLFRPPQASVGQISLDSLDLVAGMDLSSIRLVSGQPVQGMLGMDFLGKYIVHIDIEHGKLLFLKSVPTNAGVEIPMSWEPGEYPFVTAEIAPDRAVRFVVDTGCGGFDTGSMGILEIRSLEDAGQFREIGKVLNESISGTSRRSLFQGGVLRMEGFSVRSTIFSESYGQTTPGRRGVSVRSAQSPRPGER